MGNKFLLLVAIFLLSFPGIQSTTSGQNMFEVDKGGDVTASITNASLQEVLKNFCSTFNLEVKGVTASDETISLSITKGTFDETLKRLMRGYNYVLMQDATLDKLALIVLGKAERSKYAEVPASRAAAEPTAYAPIAMPPSQQELIPPPSPSPASAQGNPLSPNQTFQERQKQQDEERTGSVVASARPTHTETSTSSTTPPMPPNIPGVELPPMPPMLEQAKQAQQSAVTTASSNPQGGIDTPPQLPGEKSSGSTSLQTPPEIPTTSSPAQQKPKPTVNLKDFAPPAIPF